MKYKYLYIDDAEEGLREALAKQLSNEKIQVDTKHVSEVILSNTCKIIELIKEYDGLLLDLRLDEIASEGEERIKVPFTATVYAQHIRTLVTNGDINKDVPIILLSTDDKLKKVYSVDLTSQDLFDRYIEKTRIPNNAIKKMFSLAGGYEFINNEKNKNIENLLKLKTIDDLDGRIFARFARYDDITIPTHEYVQTILKDLIYSPGVLINELLLASRFGIDIDNSADWDKLKEIFKDTKYNGVFSDGWERWWMHLIDNLFYEKTETYLSYLDADERVDSLKKCTGLTNLVPAKPIEKNSSNRFWTYCKVLDKPLDPLEGFKVNTPIEPKPWQEYDYCSLYAILTQQHKEKNISIHPNDKERLNLARSEY